MRISECVGCKSFPCNDVRHDCYVVPGMDIDTENISVVLISESAPADVSDDYYAAGDPQFARTTLLAFGDAGVHATSIKELVERGVYFTTAVKCGKTGYGIQKATIKECSKILEHELDLFPNVSAYLLMGDVAIQAVNEISRRTGAGRAIPAGSTYKVRGPGYYFRGRRAFPSYLQAGPSFGIEKSKRKMIAEDISTAMAVAGT